MPRAARSKNVGEWSEVYALAYLLSEGGGYGADDQQEAILPLFYKVLAALFKGEVNGADLIYKVKDEEIENKKKYALKRKKIVKRLNEIEFSFPENYTKEILFANRYGSEIYENTEFIKGEIVMNVLELKETINYFKNDGKVN